MVGRLSGWGDEHPTSGLAWYLSTPNGVGDWLLPMLNPDSVRQSGLRAQHLAGHSCTCWSTSGMMVGGSILFAKFWIMTTNMGPEAVARQIESSGLQIPGFRRDPRVLKRVLERYIPIVTVISGATVGGLAAGADLIGTVGNASGTGVLLSVGIMIQFYEAIGREQMMEMHPVLRGFFGGEWMIGWLNTPATDRQGDDQQDAAHLHLRPGHIRDVRPVPEERPGNDRRIRTGPALGLRRLASRSSRWSSPARS